MKIDFSSFVRRQTAESQFTHWTLSDEEVLSRVNNGFENRKAGYRDGVVLVPVPPDGFFTSVVKLKEGDKLEGEFRARREGEEPRKSVCAKGDKTPAKSVDVVLYRKDVLAEGNENSTDADWEIVSINASPEEGELPIMPDVLIANHFVLSGGTATNMSDSEFVETLRKSVLYWKDKALVSGK